MNELLIPLFISSIGYLIYEFTGSPLNNYNPNRVFSYYSYLVAKIVLKIRGEYDYDLIKNMSIKNQMELTVNQAVNNLGYFKLLLCGFCYTSWVTIITSFILLDTPLEILSYIGIGLLANILIFKK